MANSRTRHCHLFDHYQLRQRGYVSPVSVCLSANGITKKTVDQIFMKIYGMVGHNPETKRLDFE